MFKFTIVVIAALAVSASMAANVPRQQQQMQDQQNTMNEPMGAATVLSHQQKQQKPYVYVADVKEQHAGHAGLGAVATMVVGQLKSLGAKGLIKIALITGLVATAVAVSVAGLVAIVTSLWATAMRFKHGMAGGNKFAGAAGEWAESRVDEISEFVLDAFNKYSAKQ